MGGSKQLLLRERHRCEREDARNIERAARENRMRVRCAAAPGPKAPGEVLSIYFAF